MKIIKVEKDIVLFGVMADSFPQGVQQAWLQLHQLIPPVGRTFYGISHGTPTGEISYKACVQQLYDGEAEQFGYKSFVLPMGSYMATTVVNFSTQMHKMEEIFRKILSRTNYDENGCCVEWYTGENNVVCMVKQRENH